MKTKIIYIVFIWFTLISCNNNEKSVNKGKSVLFREFSKKFKPIDLPFTYNERNIRLEKFNKINPKSFDTLFIKTNYPDETYCYGIIKDTSKYVALIFFFPADNYYPQIITFTKDGEKIDETSLSIGGCSGDCGLTKCSAWGILNKDLTILCSDTITYSFQCDEKGDSIPNSGETIILVKSGELTDNGMFKMNAEKRTGIKNVAP